MSNEITGNLLVATPSMDQTPLKQSVCLVLHQDDSQVVGVMLNRPIEGEFDQGSDASDETLEMLARQGLHLGGPSAGPILALHNCEALGEVKTGTGLYVAATRDRVEKVLSHDLRCRLVVGHMQWSVEELHEQLNKGCWAVVPAAPDSIFLPDDSMWMTMLRKANSFHLASLVGAKHIPAHPALN